MFGSAVLPVEQAAHQSPRVGIPGEARGRVDSIGRGQEIGHRVGAGIISKDSIISTVADVDRTTGNMGRARHWQVCG